MQKKLFSLLIALAMVVALTAPLGQGVKGAASVSVGSIPSYIPIDCSDTGTPGNGTPIAVFVSVTGGAANTTYQIKSRVGFTTPTYSSTDLIYAIWWANVGTLPYSWGTDTTAWSSTWPIITDGSGNWSGWLVTKVNTSITTKTNFDWSKNIFYVARFREGSNNRDSGSVSITPLNMSSSGSGTLGGWIEGSATLNGSPAQNKVVVVKSGTTIIGIYLTEDNGVNEGYSSTPGYFKVGVPAGGPYTLELWDPATNAPYVGSATVDSVTAGNVTSGVILSVTANAAPTLDWTGEEGYESDGVEPSSGASSTTFVYRVKYTDADNDAPLSGYPKVHILKSSVEISGSPFAMNEVDSSDTTYTDGKLYTYSTTLSAGSDYTYYFEAKDANSLNATGTPTSPQAGPTVSGDGIPPVIYGVKPYRMSSTYDVRPDISASYTDDDSGIDKASAYVKLDGVDVTSQASVTSTGLTYTPSSDLTFGTHTVEVGVSDNAGNLKTLQWYFTIIEPLTTPNHYFGVPHSHTSYSDGALTPYDAFTYARDTANIDFLAITDHSNSIDATEWADTLTQADAFTEDGVFVGLRGFEYTHTADGHINVYNSDTYVSRNDSNYNTITKFYTWLKSQPDGVFAQFNHPFTLDDFLGFAYDSDVDKKMTLQEVGNGSPPYSYARLEEAYIYALDKGWHVGATNGQDNHSENWGYPPDNLTGIVANNLTKQDVIDALILMRTYSSEDRNLSVSFLANDYWMGSTIPVTGGEKIQFTLEINDPDATDDIDTIQIITKGGEVLYEIPDIGSNSYSGSYDYIFSGGGKWFYLKVVEQDGNIAITAPIWTPSADIDLKVTGLSYSPKTVLPGKLTTLTATVTNSGLNSYTGLTLSFYDGDPDAGGILIGTNTVDVPEGALITSSVSWTPTTSGKHTIYAVLEVPTGDEPSDNVQTAVIDVVQSIGKTVLIDRYHKNDYTSTTGLSNLTEFADLLAINGYNVIDSNQEITTAVLIGVDVLVITYPQSGTGQRDISSSEMDAIRAFVANGGALLFTGKSNYGEDPTRYNDFLTSMGIGMIINHDNIYDDIDNYGYQWSLNLRNFPDTPSGIGKDISNVRFFSGATLIKPDKTALVSDPTNNIEVLAFANTTSWDEDDTTNLTHVGEGYYIYSYHSNPNGSSMPAMAVQTLPNGSRVAVLGRAIFSNYEFGNWIEGQAACNNEAFTLRLVDWLSGYNRTTTIAEARADEDDDGVPDRLDEKVTITGKVTSGTGKFFDVIYLQDETGGITVFGTVPSDKIIQEGAVMQVTGVIDHYNGDIELQFSDFSKDFLWVGWTTTPEPRVFSTGALNLEENEGWLVKTEGFVTEVIDAGTCKINDGSGDIIVFIDGYIGTLPAGTKAGDYMVVIGLSGEYAGGHRIRVRQPSDIEVRSSFIITSTATSGGTISPVGDVSVSPGGSQTFEMTPNPNYYLKQVLVDGVIVFPVGMEPQQLPTGTYTYTFTNVISDHTIHAVFAPGFLQYVITASAGEGGTISPSGDVLVSQFDSQTFTITPNTGYHIYDVKVDGASVLDELVDNTYTFENVSDNHTIEAYFEHNYIKTTYPVGTEVFLPTDAINVTWDVAGFAGTEGKIRVLFYNGLNWTIVASNLDLSDGSFDITLSDKTIVDPLRCRVRAGIYDPATGAWLTWGTNGQYYDESGHFWIVDTSPTKYFKTTAPIGTEVFSPTSTIHITWDEEGFTETEGKVRVLFYNGSTWSLVASNLNLADGSFDLNLSTQTIVDPLRCRVRVGAYDPVTGAWLTWGTNGQYYDESGHFWVIEQELPPTNSIIYT